MHKRTKLTQLIREQLYQKYKEWFQRKELTILYMVHYNTICKVIKRGKLWDFTVHKSTRNDYRSIEYNLKRLSRIELTINKKRAKRGNVVRYEKQYAWELWHIDVHKLKNIKGQNPKKKKYLASIIDDATRMSYTEIIHNKKAKTLAIFMKRAYKWFRNKGITIQTLLSDNGLEFTTHHKRSRQYHSFEKILAVLWIKHRYTRVCRPQTNGKVERFWRIIKDNFSSKYHFEDWKDFSIKFYQWLFEYNHKRKHWWIKFITPFEKLQLILIK